MIEFRIEREKSSFFNPSENKVEEVEVEIRFDPLTGKTSRIVPKPLPISSDPDIMDEIRKPEFCPFCPEYVEKVVARDVNIIDGILKRGEAILFPNISPYALYSIVVRISDVHYIPLEKFDEKKFLDAFILIQEYFKRAVQKDKTVRFGNISMNYLKPAGSSITHPHIQATLSRYPTDYHRRMYEGGRSFFSTHGKSYWKVLAETEKGGERYIGRTGEMEWITPFSPRGFAHVMGISERDFLRMDEDRMKDISEGIVRTLRAYDDMHFNSFNFSIFLPPLQEMEGFLTVIDIVARSNLDRYYWNDCFFLSKLHDEGFSNLTPEEVAEKVKKWF